MNSRKGESYIGGHTLLPYSNSTASGKDSSKSSKKRSKKWRATQRKSGPVVQLTAAALSRVAAGKTTYRQEIAKRLNSPMLLRMAGLTGSDSIKNTRAIDRCIRRLALSGVVSDMEVCAVWNEIRFLSEVRKVWTPELVAVCRRNVNKIASKRQ